MSDRERWIVYPLLFLTLGIALRNQFLPTRRFGALDLKAGELTAQKILCNDLVIYQKGECNQLQCGQFQFDEAFGKHASIAGLAECVGLKAGEAAFRRMLVVDAEGRPVVLAGTDINTQAGVIETRNANGMTLVQVRSTGTGGAVTTRGLGGKVLVEMGTEGQNFGVFAQFPQIGRTIPLTSPWQFSTGGGGPRPSQTPGAVAPQQPESPRGTETPQGNQPQQQNKAQQGKQSTPPQQETEPGGAKTP
jgi:hypothetical protein